jgi:hypothetical protein
MSALRFFLHESAYMDSPATIGEGARSWHFSHILCNVTLGRFCNLGQNVMVGLPARRIGWMSEAGGRRAGDLVYPIDGSRHQEGQGAGLERLP